MTVKNVTVVEVEKLKAGKVDRLVLHYVGNDKTTWKIGALAPKLDEDSRKKLLSSQKDDVICIELLKEGNFWNLVKASDALTEGSQVTPTTTTTSPDTKKSYNTQSTAGGFVKSKETDTRIQVMNALTNAIVSLGAGKTTKEYKERVMEFVTLGNQVVEQALNGDLTALAQESTVKNLDVDAFVDTTTDDVVEELGF